MSDVNQLTVRGISPQVERVIREEARKRGVSLNKAILTLLERAAGVKKEGGGKAKAYHDLDALCGLWTKEEQRQFLRAAGAQRAVDDELWK